MTEINFYCIDKNISSFLYKFLLQLVKQGEKIVLYSESEEKVESLDKVLWTLGRTEFLPHGTHKEKDDQHLHPLYLTVNKENPNEAEFLLISNHLDDESYLNSFKKVFYVFSSENPSSLNSAKKAWGKYEKKHTLKCWKIGKDKKWKAEDSIECF